MRTTYDPQSSMRVARDKYFKVNAFGADGGYEDAWVDFKLGPVPFPFPNTKSRLAALAFHDLHHILTGYDTDIRGELEISAWEIGAGCRSMVAAWVLNLSGMTGGILAAPKRTFRAFVRGRHSDSFYGRELDALLRMKVEDARALMRVDAADDVPARLSDVALFSLSAVAGLAVGTALMSVLLPLAPVGFVAGHLARRRAMKASASAAHA